VDDEYLGRQRSRLVRLHKKASFKMHASLEEIDYEPSRGLKKTQVLEFTKPSWISNHQNVILTGATGVGKTYLACALAHAAIRRGHTALYLRAPRLFGDLAVAHADGRFPRLTAAWARVDVLVIDDLALQPLTPDQAADLLEVIEDRSGLRSTIVTSQLPVSHWHEAIGDPTIADAALDRLLENAHRIELAGESMRQAAPAPSPQAGRA